MHHCCDPAMGPTAPSWVLALLIGLFMLGVIVRVIRFFNPAISLKYHGFTDAENEIGHGWCDASMAACMSTAAFLPSPMFWGVTLSLGSVWFAMRALSFNNRGWFLARACNWEYKLSHSRPFYEWAHVLMLGDMARMYFLPMPPVWLQVLSGGWWIYFTYCNLLDMWHNIRQFNAVKLWAAFEHVLAGVVMFIMTVWPMVLMRMAH